jgi:Caspase domain
MRTTTPLNRPQMPTEERKPAWSAACLAYREKGREGAQDHEAHLAAVLSTIRTDQDISGAPSPNELLFAGWGRGSAMRWVFAVASVLGVLVWSLPAAAQSRVALVVGNQAYTGKVQPLKNPHNDIKTVGQALETIGFKVTRVPDAGRRQMLSAVKNLAAELAKGGPTAIGFLYYSGHGVARPEDRANYLIPVDLKDTSSTDFWFDAVKLDDILVSWSARHRLPLTSSSSTRVAKS